MVEAGTAGVDTMTTIHTTAAKAKDGTTAGHARHGRRAEKARPGTSFFNFADRLVWEDSSHAWSEKEELANLVVSKVRSDLGIQTRTPRDRMMEHKEPPVNGHFDEYPDRAMTRSEWEAIAHSSAKNAADARASSSGLRR